MRETATRSLLDDRRVPRRARLEKRARGLLIAVGRFARARAVTADEAKWAAHWIDGLEALLKDGRL